MILYIYITLGQGLKTPLDTKFWCQQEQLVTSAICCKFQNNLFEVWFFSWFNICIKPRGCGHTAPKGQRFDVNRNVLSLYSFVASLKIMSLSLILYIFYDLIHVYSPGAWADSPRGQSFDVNRNVTSFICCKFQKSVFEVCFYTFFFMIYYLFIAPGQGQTALRGRIMMSSERPYHFTHLLQVAK